MNTALNIRKQTRSKRGLAACFWSLYTWLVAKYPNPELQGLTVDPGEDAKVEDTWNFFIVLTVRGGQEE